MDDPSMRASITVLTAICVGVAALTDLRRRRIPNVVTLPAVVVGVGLWMLFHGWKGLAISLGGTCAAPLLLVLLHLGRGPGMGDIKLAAAVGSLLGPELSSGAMLLAGMAGGLIALGWQLRAGGPLACAVSPFLVGIPGLQRWTNTVAVPTRAREPSTLPYALAIGMGSMAALLLSWCMGGSGWLL